MTALSEALLTAQRGALAAMQKAYVRGKLEPEVFEGMCDMIGAADKTDRDLLIASLEIMRNLGAEAPTNGAAPKPDADTEPASEAQWTLIRKLAGERGKVAPDEPLTKARASQAITALKAGTYNADDYTVPF